MNNECRSGLCSSGMCKPMLGCQLHFTSSTDLGLYLRHASFLGMMHSDLQGEDDTKFWIRPCLANALANAPDCGSDLCISFEASIKFKGYYFRHQNFELSLKMEETNDLYRKDASFCLCKGILVLKILSALRLSTFEVTILSGALRVELSTSCSFMIQPRADTIHLKHPSRWLKSGANCFSDWAFKNYLLHKSTLILYLGIYLAMRPSLPNIYQHLVQSLSVYKN